ncbi:hypothetical protein QFC22_005441 [Naganishia vaughanmartiniae]|uniref:Uncharacterized protein n=1 Tax=Naganishia vaughanmartiniae TaxID=1424756 RepID=A0ACC2WVF4_9TREE|nr:hypothetical protein QFC22_005441 [Naganishia vaughanmartiniae]
MPSIPKLLLLSLAIFGAIMVQADPRVLVYTATFGYRHDSIPTAIEVLRQHGPQYNVSFDFTEDPKEFTQDNLANYDGVLFVSTSEEVLDETGKAAFQDWLQKGGVFAGAHSASACLYNTSFFNATVGALFDYHPDLQSALKAKVFNPIKTFLPVNKTHPATAHLPDRWTFEEEVYYYRSDPRAFDIDLLLTVDESSYSHTGQSTGTYNEGEPHPIDGKTTRAYNANALVGNATLNENSAVATNSATAAGTASASRSGGMAAAGTTGAQSSLTATTASSPAASSTSNGASGNKIAGGAVALAVAGVAIIGM